MKISEKIQHTKVIEVSLPFYYKINHLAKFGDYCSYYKVDKCSEYSIMVSDSYCEARNYEINKQTHNMTLYVTGHSFEEMQIIEEAEFETVRNECLLFLNSLYD